MRRSAEFGAAIRGGRRAGRGSLVVHLAPTQLGARRSGVVADGDRGGGYRAVPPPHEADVTSGDGVITPPPVRVGFVVPKSVGGAVVRNRVRRRLRHLIRARLGDVPPGAAVVIRVLPGAGGLPSTVLAEQLDAALGAARSGGRRPRQRHPAEGTESP